MERLKDGTPSTGMRLETMTVIDGGEVSEIQFVIETLVKEGRQV